MRFGFTRMVLVCLFRCSGFFELGSFRHRSFLDSVCPAISKEFPEWFGASIANVCWIQSPFQVSGCSVSPDEMRVKL